MFSLVLKRMAAISNVCNHGFIPLSLLGNIAGEHRYGNRRKSKSDDGPRVGVANSCSVP